MGGGGGGGGAGRIKFARSSSPSSLAIQATLAAPASRRRGVASESYQGTCHTLAIQFAQSPACRRSRPSGTPAPAVQPGPSLASPAVWPASLLFDQILPAAAPSPTRIALSRAQRGSDTVRVPNRLRLHRSTTFTGQKTPVPPKLVKIAPAHPRLRAANASSDPEPACP